MTPLLIAIRPRIQISEGSRGMRLRPPDWPLDASGRSFLANDTFVNVWRSRAGKRGTAGYDQPPRPTTTTNDGYDNDDDDDDDDGDAAVAFPLYAPFISVFGKESACIFCVRLARIGAHCGGASEGGGGGEMGRGGEKKRRIRRSPGVRANDTEGTRSNELDIKLRKVLQVRLQTVEKFRGALPEKNPAVSGRLLTRETQLEPQCPPTSGSRLLGSAKK
ncbi:hypothetical protein KM043_015509 [Ampulex compressa]|nr:hypothetical protein KM043_015509 [Ampulex compressa]